MLKIATPGQHPFSSHISRFAMFPSYHSPDTPETGVRVASQPLLSPPQNGAPTQHTEVIATTPIDPSTFSQTPMKTRKKAVNWTGDHGVLDHIKPLKGEKQVFYPAPPNKASPSPKIQDWDLQTKNMPKHLERTRWVTSYQMHYAGSGTANPLKIDELKEKMSGLTVMNSHSAPLVQGSEMSQEVLHRQHTESKRFVREGRERENCTHQFDESLMQVSQHSQEANAAWTADTERPLDLYNRPLSQEEMDANGEKSLIKLSVKAEPSRKKENFKAGRNSSLCQSDVVLADTESHAELLSRAASEQEKVAKGRELPHSISDPCILPRRPVLPGIRPVDRVGTEGAALSLLHLQNTFSKSMVHRNFNSSITHAAVNLRDNVVTGKKHDFYGINSYYLHG
ncbi:sperm-associated microtubule inner protein 4-like [Chaetodon trifascialis]|uniref:sperm-associated microtubule inner protein 4-like n=1 Tax=Chaetodon trifascialis TaxID=109706 RepID=UPI0039939B2D